MDLACATQHGAEHFVAGAEVVEQHPGGCARRLGERLEAIGEPVSKSVFGALIQQVFCDCRLLLSAHGAIISRNSRYV